MFDSNHYYDSTLAAVYGDRVIQEYEDALLNPKYYEEVSRRPPYTPPNPFQFAEPVDNPESEAEESNSNLWEDLN